MKKTLLLIGLLFCFFASKAQIAPIAGTMAVNGVVNNLKKQIEDLLASMEGTFSRQSFDVRQHGMVLIGNLDYVLEKNINKTFNQLDIQQQRLLNDISFMVAELKEPINQTADRVEGIVSKTTGLVATLPGSKRPPLLSKIGPTFVTQAENEDVKLRVKGTWLSFKDPYIVVGSEHVKPITETDEELVFIIPSLKTDSAKAKMNSFPLVVYEKKFLGKRVHNYTIGTTIVPNLIGKYTIKVNTINPGRLTEQRSQETTHRNDHCQGARDVIMTITPKTGWKIDVNSIVHRGNVRENSVYNGLRSVTEYGYQVTGVARNSGSCGYFGRDARGKVNLFTSWTEYQDITIPGQVKTFANRIFWGHDVVDEFPSNTSGFIMTVTKVNGEQVVITDSYNNDKWFQVIYNRSNNTVILRPRDIQTALN